MKMPMRTRGLSLVELVVVIAVGSGIAATVGVLMHRLSRSEKIAVQREDAEISLSLAKLILQRQNSCIKSGLVALTPYTAGYSVPDPTQAEPATVPSDLAIYQPGSSSPGAEILRHGAVMPGGIWQVSKLAFSQPFVPLLTYPDGSRLYFAVLTAELSKIKDANLGNSKRRHDFHLRLTLDASNKIVDCMNVIRGSSMELHSSDVNLDEDPRSYGGAIPANTYEDYSAMGGSPNPATPDRVITQTNPIPMLQFARKARVKIQMGGTIYHTVDLAVCNPGADPNQSINIQTRVDYAFGASPTFSSAQTVLSYGVVPEIFNDRGISTFFETKTISVNPGDKLSLRPVTRYQYAYYCGVNPATCVTRYNLKGALSVTVIYDD